MHEILISKLSNKNGTISARDIVDIMNIIGKCVISGNIRRVAEIAIGECKDKEFI